MIMLGVVLWSDSSDRKAVIWCEDQGDLAFVNAADGVLHQGEFFDAGDLVQFDMQIKDSTRRACNTRLVIEQVGTCLTDVLKSNPNDDVKGQIIPFSPPRGKSRIALEESSNERLVGL